MGSTRLRPSSAVAPNVAKGFSASETAAGGCLGNLGFKLFYVMVGWIIRVSIAAVVAAAVASRFHSPGLQVVVALVVVGAVVELAREISQRSTDGRDDGD